jgi:non-specific serine/threonine protein kinase
VERAYLHRPELELTPQSAEVVAQICRRLDGIPLAIELAAARVKVLSIDQIAVRLDDRFQLLTGGGRTALPRQQTLRAAMDWSYDLLAEPEQALLRALSVFAGGFTLEAAEAVGGQIFDLLASLVDKSLVIAEEQDGSVRYRLLETVRQYAAEKLDAAGEAAAVRERHREWFLAMAEAADEILRGPREAEWLTRLEQEHGNLRAALRWSVTQGAATVLRLAGALSRFWESRGHLAEGRDWLAQALAADGEAPAAVRARALQGAGALAAMQGEFAAAQALHEQALRLYQQVNDRPGVAESEGALGRVAFRQGDYAAARAALESSLALYLELGHKLGIASVKGALGMLALRQGDHATARALIEDRLAINRELGNKDGAADALDDLATVAWDAGDGEQHVALVEESLALSRELGNRTGVALALSSLGMAAWTRSEYDRALALLEESMTLSRAVGDRRGIARVLGYQAMVALYQRDYARAESLSRGSVALYRDLGDVWAMGRYLGVLAGATFALGEGERAARLFGAAAALHERLGTPLPPAIRPAYDRTIAALRRSLGETAFAAAWSAGGALSPEEMAALALGAATPA